MDISFLNCCIQLLFICQCVYGLPLEYSKEFFNGKQIALISALICNRKEMFEFSKLNSGDNKRTNVADPAQLDLSKLILVLNYTVPNIGVVMNMKCPGIDNILNWASNNRLFDTRRRWLLYLDDHYDEEELKKASDWYEPEMFDPQQYLDMGNENMTEGIKIAEFNADINKEVLVGMSREKLEYQKKAAENSAVGVDDATAELKKYMNLTALVDSDVTLAIPFWVNNETVYDLYEVHRKTIYTKMMILHVGRMEDNKLIWTVDASVFAVLRRSDLQGAVLKSAAAVQKYDYFSRSGELTSIVCDNWAQANLQLTQLVEAQRNFRMLVKTFDVYGWLINGQYTGMSKAIASQDMEFVATGFLLTTLRMPAVQFLDATFELETAMIFRLPLLSQVSNIFLLPFSPGVWLACGGLLLLVILALFLQLKATHNIEHPIQLQDIVTFFTAAACQQGLNLAANTVSVRVTAMVFDLASLFLFISYSANIVALLQSTSDSINTISDLTESTLDVAIEKLPYEIKLFEEEKSPAIRNLCLKKLTPKKEKAFMNYTEGISKVRTELFAYYGELTTAYREIGLTFNEAEKNGLKTIPAFPHIYNGPGVYKNSPYREVLTSRYFWIRETGLRQRTAKRWVYGKPQTRGDSAGFNSVAMTDMEPVFLVFIYGCFSALSLFVLEMLYAKIKRARKGPTIFAIKKMKIKRNI